ncbi:MAG: cell wall-binding repeat-containing protein [Lachnospiraceae bacterium]|nr:cell wall-binding repeat-containing protein [Lachnospiraceae bacterium]
MKKLKFLLASLMVMIAFCCVTQVHANTNPVFSVDKVTAMPGDHVNVEINVQNNPGIASLKLKVQYDEANLTLNSVTYNEDIGGEFMQPQQLISPVTLNWYNGATDSEGDWIYATLAFEVSENANAGTYPITISYEADNVYDITETNINFAIKNGGIIVKEANNESEVYRIAGKTRYETSLKIAEALKEQLGVDKFDTVIVADGRNFPDALAGSYLAGKLNAPILMANEKSQYAEPLKTYIKENLKSSGTIYVLGGTGAVPESVLSGLSGYNVYRLAGKTRYETNLMILEEAGVSNEEILVCTGRGFADSLSASATGKPILLVGKSMTAEQQTFMSEHKGNRYYIIGGENAVSKEIESVVRKYGTTERISGSTRYETSILVAEAFFDVSDEAVLAYAKNFPDGLCGGPLALSKNAPLILTATGKEANAVTYAKENGMKSGVVLGGSGLISDDAAMKIFAASTISIW